MPFTISHIAAILPFKRVLAKGRLLSAAIIGSMVPDFGFLLMWHLDRPDTHSFKALLTFCLPVGLVTFWLFQLLMKRPISEILPDGTYARWRSLTVPADIRSVSQWLLAIIGIEAGAVTHVVWDAFTHEGARGVRMIPFLDDSIFEVAGHLFVGSRLLQDVSSVIGLGIVLLFFGYEMRPWRAKSVPVERKLPRWERNSWMAAYVVVAIVLAALFLLIRRPHFMAGGHMSIVLANYAIAALRGFAAALVVVSLSLILRLRAIRPADRSATAVATVERDE